MKKKRSRLSSDGGQGASSFPGRRAGEGSPAYARMRSAILRSGLRVDVRHGASTRLAETNRTGLEREERVVPAEPDVLAWVDLGTDLTNDDRARIDLLAPKDLDASPLAV